jgi:hypothetical protein
VGQSGQRIALESGRLVGNRLLQPDDWQASWIEAAKMDRSEMASASPMLRKEFFLKGEILLSPRLCNLPGIV